MRLFVALLPPPEALEDLDEFLAPRREVAQHGLRWSPIEFVHLTLAFLPDVAEGDLDLLEDRLREAAEKRSPFTARIAGGGAFPDPAAARVLWCGFETDTPEGRQELERLAVGTRNAAGVAGSRVDGGRFRAHLTVARLRRAGEATRWLRILETYRGPSWRVRDIALVASHLGQGRGGSPRYETMSTFRLGGEPEDPRDLGGLARRAREARRDR